MKSIAVFLLPLLAYVSAIEDTLPLLPARQDVEPMLRMLNIPRAPSSRKTNHGNAWLGRLKAMRNDTKVKKIRYGPFTLPPANKYGKGEARTEEKGSISIFQRVDPLCTDCMVLQGKIYLEYKNGTFAGAGSGLYNHHSVILNLSKKQNTMLCPGGRVSKMPRGPAFFLGGAVDTDMQIFTTSDGQFKSGHYIKPKAHHMMMSQLMNYKMESQQVYIVAEAEYVPGLPPGYLDVISVPISVSDCLKVEFKVSKPHYSKSSGDLIIPRDSYIVNMMGHMHDGGTSVSFKLNHKVICDSVASYSNSSSSPMGGVSIGGSSISEMSGCGNAVTLRKGDKFSVTANFDTVKHPMRMGTDGQSEGVMGIGVVKFAYPLDSKFF